VSASHHEFKFDFNFKLNFIFTVKTIAALDLRNDLEGVVKALKRGERMALTYRGELVGELSPPSAATAAEGVNGEQSRLPA
jgi:antitoxin (DNA-binding transcriptional repressor) of toxin-antitoxin stability system